jgi:hypothetical protein
MKSKKIAFSVFVIIAALLLAACGVAPGTPIFPPLEETPDLVALATASAVASSATSAAPPGSEATPVSEASPTTAAPTEAQPSPLPPTQTTAPQPSETPAGTAAPEDCTNLAEFVDDVTVEDDTEFLPGEKFTKTWRLRNAGTCTWTQAYALVFAKGDQLGGPSEVSLPGEAAPGKEIDVSVELAAPATVGTYRGDWQLRSRAGKIFGLGKNADKTFYVQIGVAASTSDLNLGSPDWKDTFESAASWFLLDTDNSLFEVDDGRLVMTAREAGEAEEWGLANRPDAADFYLEATFVTGEACAGLDRYGMLVRAPEPNEGYVFSFSCDGRYRVYKWDGENYNGIIEWKTSPHIKSGPDQTNRLGVWANGSTLKFYANGKLLAEFEEDTYAEGRFGLLIGSSKTEDLKVYVEEISYWNLEE